MPYCRRLILFFATSILTVAAWSQETGGSWQTIVEAEAIPRLDQSVLSVGDPAARVTGTPGSYAISERSCTPFPEPQLRRRIVDIAVQEWAWFGFAVDDLHGTSPPRSGEAQPQRRRFLPLNPEQVARVAGTVSGYWSAIPNSDWILARQNDVWREPSGLSARWRDPWSAAFISWVMCEAGVQSNNQFQRAIAHHTYIDQAIRASDGRAPEALFVAHEPGDAEISPGDLICSGLRPAYRTLAQRRTQLGEGARTHCDIVVAVDEEQAHILTIGGNVRASVRLKVFPASNASTPHLAPLPTNRYIFAHLKLKLPEAIPTAWTTGPTLSKFTCGQIATSESSIQMPARLRTLLC
jgi:hypothetical protein